MSVFHKLQNYKIAQRQRKLQSPHKVRIWSAYLKNTSFFTKAHISPHNTNNRSMLVMVTKSSFWCLFSSHYITWGKGTSVYLPQCKMGKIMLWMLTLQGLVEFNEKLCVNYLDLCLVGGQGSVEISSCPPPNQVSIQLTSLLPQEGHLLKPGPPPHLGFVRKHMLCLKSGFHHANLLACILIQLSASQVPNPLVSPQFLVPFRSFISHA